MSHDHLHDSAINPDTRQQLADYVERIESLESEKAEVSAKIKAEHALMASAGFDVGALRQILKERKSDDIKSVEKRTIAAVYRRALATLQGTPLGDWARSWDQEESRTGQRREAYRESELNAFMAGRAKGKGKNRAAGDDTNDQPGA
jgi:uncharacterized protein (UPF0335 family)